MTTWARTAIAAAESAAEPIGPWLEHWNLSVDGS
jgi:hypothetical protein